MGCCTLVQHLILFYVWIQVRLVICSRAEMRSSRPEGSLRVAAALSFGIAALILAWVTESGAQIYQYETDHLRVVYLGKMQEYLIPHTARCFENALRFHSQMFGYQPDGKITVFLQDFSDYGSGGATAVPKNGISLNIAPFSYVYETRPANERINWVMNHEEVHVVAGDKASSTDRAFRGLFVGKVAVTAEDPISILWSYLTTPRWYSPRWYHEGIAVFMETWMAGGMGRALGAYDEMVFRTMVRDSAHIYSPVGLESEGTAKDFQVGANSYMYGTRFMSYLALQYGPERLLEWVTRTDRTKRYFASQFKQVYGSDLSDEWERWIEWENEWQEANLDSIRVYQTTEGRPLGRALGSVSRSYFDPETKTLYAAVLYPGQSAHIAAMDVATGDFRRICEVLDPALYFVTSLAYDPATKTLFFTTKNNGWRDLVAVDSGTGDTRQLVKDARAGDLTFNPADRSIWGVRHYNGISTIVRIPYPYDKWNQVYSFTYGRDVYDIDLSPDGTMLAGALAHVDGTQQLIMMRVENLLAGDGTYDVLFDFENSSPENFVFSPDGKYLYGSSYYTGVSNIYRYDLAAADMSIVSNCETGLFRPIPVSEDSLIAFRYSGQGFRPCMIPSSAASNIKAIKYLGQEIVERHPMVKAWTLQPPSRVNVDSVAAVTRDYSALRSMTVASVIPIAQGYKDYAGVGLRMDLSDPIAISSATVEGSYTPATTLRRSERFHASTNWNYWNWNASAAYNGADFYDLFGPTKTSRRGNAYTLGYRRPLVYDPPKTMEASVQVAFYDDLERLPDAQNVGISFDRFGTLSARLDFQKLRTTIGAVDYEGGYKWRLASAASYVNTTAFPQVHADFDVGFLTPIEHSPVWVRTSAGYSHGLRSQPLANFYFGGFGNNWIDHLEVKRFREYYTFPGVEIDAVGGTNYGRLLLEWIMPPWRFENAGITSAYLRWARLSLFSAGLMTNVDSEAARRTVADVGAQLDFRLVTFSLMESTFSVGYAVAFEQERRLSKEFMISLKLM